ncbi:hypothetical protein DSLASN_05260 [Desulfoluna limicola]|uniref:Phage tail protein n=1 Tax=Desulfoluna limicola TaxID=2810562 RepID=A0ABN6EX02_9BACT|nr:hypothetical protein [Desulfoluna limicola]BCS94894.1 hypothetical protein DSLASN_05260 [Desulfoluna limicola]
MTYRHGVYASQVPTSITPPRKVSASLPVVVGTAPVHLAKGGAGPVNKVTMVYTYSEAVELLGYSDAWEKYTLCEFIYSHFALFALAPIVFINVFDPAVHKDNVAEGEATFADGEIKLDHGDLLGPVVIKSQDKATTYVEDTDYEVDRVAGVIKRMATGGITAGATISRTYTYADPSKVTAADIVGGVDGATGKLTGLELVNEVFPKYRLVPGLIVAPGWSSASTVSAVMTAKAKNVNGMFGCKAIIDIDDATVTRYSDAPEYKNQNNLTDAAQIVCWPKVKLGQKTFHMSTQLAGLIAQVDADNEDIPYASPSNHNFQMDAMVANGEEVWLQPEQANYLNGNGIVTALNFIGGWKCWGNRTACYPANTDPKDAWISVSRMFAWVGNTLILSHWSKLDAPAKRRLIETIRDSAQMWLDGLVSRQFLLGARVEFQADENAVTGMMDGISRFHVYMTPPSPAREIDFIQEYDPAYFSTLFA